MPRPRKHPASRPNQGPKKTADPYLSRLFPSTLFIGSSLRKVVFKAAAVSGFFYRGDSTLVAISATKVTDTNGNDQSFEQQKRFTRLLRLCNYAYYVPSADVSPMTASRTPHIQGPPGRPEIMAVSYTHLTLPTNREV